MEKGKPTGGLMRGWPLKSAKSAEAQKNRAGKIIIISDVTAGHIRCNMCAW